MKLKLKFDKKSIQEFFVLHVEKIVLGVVVGLLVLLVFMGYQLDTLNESPDLLQKKVGDATVQVNNPSNWDGMKAAPERQVVLNVPDLVNKTQQPIKPTDYALRTGWKRPDFEKLHARTDPKIYAPLKLTVTALSGPLAIKRDRENLKDPLSAFTRSGTGPTPSPRPGPGTRPGPGSRPPPGGRGPGGRPPASEYELEGMVEGPTMMEFQGDPSGNRTSLAREEGFVPGGAESTWTGGHAIVVQAVVPWEKQFEEYRRCLEKSQDFRVDRDVPFYIFFVVERADVTADPNADPATLKWAVPKGDKVPNYNYSAARKESDRWAGFPNEVLDAEYLDRALTQPAPPFIFRDLTAAMVHPDIPRVDLFDPAAENAKKNEDKPKVLGPLGEELTGTDQRNPYGGQEMGRDGSGRSLAVFTHMKHGENVFGKAGEGGGMAYPGGSSGGQILNVEKIAESVRKYKLLRFTDVTVEPGHLYRYRVKVWVEDPNHPYAATTSVSRDPSLQSLDEKVKVRLKEVAVQEQKRAATDPSRSRIFHRESDWSPPSEPVGLPSVDHYYAATVKPPVFGPVRDDRPLVMSKESEAYMVAIQWDDEKAVDVPGVAAKVKRGTSLMFKPKKVEVKHPISTQVQELDSYKFELPAVVADIRGGEPIGKAKLAAPGEILVFDAEHNWHFLNDTDDIDGVERNVWDKSLLEDEAVTPRKAPTSTANTPNIMQPGSPEMRIPPPGPAKAPGGTTKKGNQPQTGKQPGKGG